MTSPEQVFPGSDFSGSVAEIYDRHLSKVIFDPFARRVIQGLPECFSVLDVACGTGVCTRRLANVAQAGATVIALDRSESMVSLAARKLFASGSIGWVRGDVQKMPFEHDTFEIAICNFGLMFFDDKPRAMEEIHRVLMPGGLLRYTVWASSSQNPWIEVVRSVVAGAFPDCEPTWYDAPFQFSEVGPNLALMEEAGFPEVRLNPIRLPLRESNPASLARGFIQGNPSVRSLIVERKIDVEKLEEKLAHEFVKQFGSPIRSTMRAFLFEAGVIE